MWDWFIQLLTDILTWLAGAVGDWGLAIIVLTIAFRLILSPLTISSAKSSARMQAMQPRIQDIQERYADDPQRMNMELQKLYSEGGMNPLGGCLPLLLQMPIFFALFSVLRNNLPADAHFFNILDSLSMSVSDAVAAKGLAGAWVYILLNLLFGLLTFIPMFANMANQPAEQRQTSLMMGMVMGVMMIWMGWQIPAGVLLYYDTSSAWGVIQQNLVTKRITDAEKAKAAEEAKNAPIQVDVVRKERKARPHKKG